MNFPKASVLAALLLCGACSLGMADQILDTRQQSFPAAGITAARLETASGSLTVTGRPGASTIDVHAEYKGNAASREEAQRILQNLKLTMEVRGDTFFLRTEKLGNSGWSSGGIDVTVDLPSAISLTVDDGSGSTLVSEIEGDVRIKDGSGELDVRQIGGDLRIEDGSGSIRVRSAGRNVDINDGSGGIEVRGVTGNVLIEDGSGSIDVSDVGGDFDVPDDGSGSIRYSDIRGKVRIPRRK